MPIYEYRCNHCGHEFEMIRKFSDGPVSECTVCHGGVSRLISQSTFHLKGSGWYATDYARKTSVGAKGDGKDGKEAASEAGKSEEKPGSNQSATGADDD